MKLFRFAALLFASSLVVGCGDVDPDQPVNIKNYPKAIKKFDKPDQEKINALGGETYFSGKSINEVKKLLPIDYLEKQKEDLIEHAKYLRTQNLEAAKTGPMNIEQVQSIFAKNDNELQTEVNDLAAHQKYMNALTDSMEKGDPLGYVTTARLLAACTTPEVACQVAALKSNQAAYNKEVNDRTANKECKRLAVAKNRKSGLKYEILETTQIKGQTVYRTPVGWIAPSDVVAKSTAQELEDLKDAQDFANRKLQQPPPQFYTIFRPLLNLSPANPTRVALAEKAISLNAKEKGLKWDQAAKDFVIEQQNLSKAEYDCIKDHFCDRLDFLSKIMAGYVLAEDPTPPKDAKQLPCEVLAVSDCQYATPEAQKAAEEAEKHPPVRRRARKRQQ